MSQKHSSPERSRYNFTQKVAFGASFLGVITGLAAGSVSAEAPRQESWPLRPQFAEDLGGAIASVTGIEDFDLDLSLEPLPPPGSSRAYVSQLSEAQSEALKNGNVTSLEFAENLFAQINGDRPTVTFGPLKLNEAMTMLNTELDVIGELALIKVVDTDQAMVVERSSVTEVGRPPFTDAGLFDLDSAETSTDGFDVAAYPDNTIFAVPNYGSQEPDTARILLGRQDFESEVTITMVDSHAVQSPPKTR